MKDIAELRSRPTVFLYRFIKTHKMRCVLCRFHLFELYFHVFIVAFSGVFNNPIYTCKLLDFWRSLVQFFHRLCGLSLFLCVDRSLRRVCTCVSDRLRAVASSTLSGVERYRWISNRFSRPDSCESEKTVRAFRRLQCFPGNSAWCWNKAGICMPAGVGQQWFGIPISQNKQTNKRQ